MSGLTRQHFEAIARILGENKANSPMILDFIFYFKLMNPRFNVVKFHDAIDKARD